MYLRPAWVTQQVPSQPGVQRETYLKQTKALGQLQDEYGYQWLLWQEVLKREMRYKKAQIFSVIKLFSIVNCYIYICLYKHTYLAIYVCIGTHYFGSASLKNFNITLYLTPSLSFRSQHNLAFSLLPSEATESLLRSTYHTICHCYLKLPCLCF